MAMLYEWSFYCTTIEARDAAAGMGTHGEREREREMEREELDLNLTMKESDVPNGFKEYRRCVSLPEKREGGY